MGTCCSNACPLNWAQQQKQFPHLEQAGILLLGHKVGVRPLIVQELQVVSVLCCEGGIWRLLPLAPGCNHDVATCKNCMAVD